MMVAANSQIHPIILSELPFTSTIMLAATEDRHTTCYAGGLGT